MTTAWKTQDPGASAHEPPPLNPTPAAGGAADTVHLGLTALRQTGRRHRNIRSPIIAGRAPGPWLHPGLDRRTHTRRQMVDGASAFNDISDAENGAVSAVRLNCEYLLPAPGGDQLVLTMAHPDHRADVRL